VDLEQPQPFWWPVVGAAQVMLAVAAAVGFVWLAVIGVADWVQEAPSVVPFLGPVPMPTALLAGGLLLGGALAGLCRVLVDVEVRRSRQQLTERLHAVVGEVAQVWVITPVGEVLADHREVRESLAAVR
jgi:hypothetical protein